MKSHSLSQRYDMQSLRTVQFVDELIFNTLQQLYDNKDPYDFVSADFDVTKIILASPDERKSLLVSCSFIFCLVLYTHSI